MANKQRRREDGFMAFESALTAGKVVSIGDMLAQASNKAVPASDYTYTGGVGGTYGSLALAQEAFAKAFLGVSREASRAADTRTTEVIDAEGVFEFDTGSATYELGDLVGPAGDTSGATYCLYNQKVAAVAEKRLAIGRVWKRGTSVTTVLVKVFSKVINAGQPGRSQYNLVIPVTLSGLSAADLITALPIKHAFRIVSKRFLNLVAATTAAKAASLDTKINATGITGGTVALTSANQTPKGAVVEGSAITALNVGAAGDTITETASAVTAFVEGSGVLVYTIENID